MTLVKAYAAQKADLPLGPFNLERRAVGETDVQIEILYCGVCHSDLHTARNEWGGTIYPSVPGHEIVGRVTAVGNHVKKFIATHYIMEGQGGVTTTVAADLPYLLL